MKLFSAYPLPMLSIRRAMTVLLLSVLALVYTCDASSQYAVSLSDIPATSNHLDNRDNPFSTFDTGEEFLKVDEAYQLSVHISDSQLIAEWIITDHYFLYGEQFSFTIDGKTQKAQIPDGKISYDEIFEKDVEKHYVFTRATIDTTSLVNSRGQLAVTYQGCADAGLCYPPETKYYDVDLAQQTATKVSKPSSVSTPTTSATNTPKPTSIWMILFMLCFALFGGLLLNLMPCVFPVLSIKALSLINTHSSDRIRHGWSYTLGCLVTFVIIAALLLIIRDTGKAVGWGFQLQSPGMITLLIFLFIMMGMSLSGLFSFGHQWMNIGQSLAQGQGVKQSFFTGALATVVASPCTAPFMATALGYALTQPAPIALSLFATLGLGMALPFLLLSYLPKLGSYLPQPGPWMETFKQALAFPLYLTGIWLLWVLGHQIGTDSIIVVALGVVFVVFTIWLTTKKPQWQQVGMVLSLLLVASITWNNQTTPVNQQTQNNPYWESYTPDRLNQLRIQGTPVFVNLTADWCITCKANEKFVFTESTLSMMKERGIVLLEGDWTNYNADITELLHRYDRGGVPLYLLFPGKPYADAMILPQILTSKSFKRKIGEIQ